METLHTHLYFLKTEPFISNQPLNFKASSSSLAEYAAIADYEFEASSSSSLPKADEGLEVAKLGISQEIISALAKRGITRLFLIQLVIMVTLFITINKNFDLVLKPVCLKENPVTNSILEPRSVVVKPRSVVLTPLSTSPDIDQQRADQKADLRGFDHGGRGVLMP